MKVILKEHIDTLGTIGDTVKVAPGYARNYLIPKGLAIEATLKNAKALEHTKRQMDYKRNKVLEQARQLAARIEGTTLSLVHQAGEEGKLFGTVTNMELSEQLKALGIEIDRKRIVLTEPIKQVGEFIATVKLHPELSATLRVTVSKA